MASAVGGFEESKHIENLDRLNKNYIYINQSTRQWTAQKLLLKAANRGFSYATARKEGGLQA